MEQGCAFTMTGMVVSLIWQLLGRITFIRVEISEKDDR